MKEAFIVLGMVFGYTFGYIFYDMSGGWRYTYGITAPLALVMFFGIYSLPPSARWLALKGRADEAVQSLKFVTPTLPQQEVEAIKEVAR